MCVVEGKWKRESHTFGTRNTVFKSGGQSRCKKANVKVKVEVNAKARCIHARRLQYYAWPFHITNRNWYNSNRRR
jgi:hypothetical protein